MKTKLSFTILLSLVFGILSSQVPQGFNYQAIARDGGGVVLPNTPLQVMLYIQASSSGGTLFWKELHSSVTTNAFGLFNLVVGTGIRQPESTAATFDLIDWSITPKYLKTEIYYSGSWVDMGTSQLMSVPYAMTSGDIAGTVDKLSVKGTTSGLEEALFEVKNKDGQTVFAVYNEGVRIYVSDGAKAVKGGFAVGGFGTDKAESTKYFFVGKDSVRIYLDTNPLTKGIKSGFAVGGYDLTKGTVQNYLDVSSDSVRIYIDSNPDTKKVKGGFAVGGYDMTKGTNTNYMNVNPDATGIINPSQNRILWYPLKNAFLTGRVLIENKDSIGTNSFASGFESKAKGGWSQALGYQSVARGDYSTAIGKNAAANKINSFAFGDSARAINSESYAIGRGAVASGYRSFAFGSAGRDSAGNVTDVARALGDYSFAIGQGSKSYGKGAVTIGLADSASGDYSVAFGYRSIASGKLSIAMGNASKASGYGSTASGTISVASGNYSLAMGYFAAASKTNSIALGYMSRSLGPSSVAIGQYTNASYNYSIALGAYTTSSNLASVAMGFQTTASGYTSTALGNKTTASNSSSTAMGLNTTASGTVSTALGAYTTAPSGYEIALGRYNTSYTPVSTTGWESTDRLLVLGNGQTSSSPSDAFTILKNGNIGIGVSSPTTFKIMVTGGAYCNGTNWVNASDRNLKENFEVVNSAEILALLDNLPVTKWNYKSDDPCIRHIGPVAQDFYTIFELGYDNKSISTVDPSGIAIVAIKELSNQNKVMKRQIDSYKSENDNLKSQLQSLQEEVAQIKSMFAKGGE